MKKKLLCIAMCLVLFVSGIVCTFAASAEAPAASDGKLKFGKDGNFVILQITDPQDDAYPAADMLNLVSLSISTFKPDLIVFTGDIVEDSRGADPGVDEEDTREGCCVYREGTDEVLYEETKKNVIKATDNLLSVVNATGIPFAVAQGNNDYKCAVTSADWLEIFSKYGNCLVKDESEDAKKAIDYNIEILSSDGTKTAFNLWFMDTLSSGVKSDQVKWYKSESDKLKKANGGNPVPSFVFQHIGVKESWKLFRVAHIWESNTIAEDGVLYKLNTEIADGYYDSVRAPGTSEEFRAWKNQGDVIGAYFGHEHTLGFKGTYKGIDMGYTYGAQFAKSGPYGVRVLTLHENDINNYDNVLYRYEGSVKTNNARFEKDEFKNTEPVCDSFIERVKAALGNILINIPKIFDSL